MLSSSASRREAAAARATKSGELPKSAGISWKDVAAAATAATATAKSGELTKAVAAVREAAAVHHEGWMVRYGRRKIGRSFFHTRYFVLESRLLAYYKKKPKDNMVRISTISLIARVPLKSLLIDGNCRVEDRGLKTHHGQMIYVLCVYNQKEKEHQITMGAHDIEDALVWKNKIELLIDQKPDPAAKSHKAFATMDFDMELGGQFSLSDRDSAAEDEEEQPTLVRRKTIGNGPPDSVHDWTKDADFGLRVFEELLEVEYLARSCSRAMRAVGVVEATCEAIFGLMMSMDATRYEWDCSFRQGSLVEEVDGLSGLGICVMFGIGDAMMMEAMYHSVLQILNCVSGLREYFSQTDDIHITPRIPAMESMADVASSQKDEKPNEVDLKTKTVDQEHAENKNMGTIDEESDDDEDYQVPEADIEVPDIAAASYLMELAAIDWFKDTKRMDNVGRQKNCVAQVAAEKGMHTFVVNLQIPGSTHYSLVMYFVTSSLKKGSLLQRFFDGDEDFRNSRLKLIPSVPKVDVDIGSSAVANGVLGLVFGVVTTLVVDMAFLIQANTYEELPEQVIGAARLAHVEPSTAVVPDLENSSASNKDNSSNDATSSEDDSSKKTN
nr:unnamed protein product [Digitaria exilis]